MKVRDMDRLGLLMRNDDISTLSNDDVCDFLVLSKVVSDSLESLVPVFKKEFQKREIGNYVDSIRKIEIKETEENNTSEIDVRQLFSKLNFDDFISLVKAIKSNAKNKEQKSAIELCTTVIEKRSRVVKIKQASKKELVL